MTSWSKMTYEKNAKAKFSKILVAIDGSEHSMKAAEYAIYLARDNNAQLIALTVLDITKIGYAASAFIASPMHGLDELEQKRKEAHEWLDKVGKLTSSQKANDAIHFKSQIEESMSVAGTIVDFAENQNIDLIVVGSRGRSGFTKLLLGSVASRVVTYASCPVLVIKWNRYNITTLCTGADAEKQVTEGLDLILTHLKNLTRWPRTISTKVSEWRQIQVYSKQEAL